jgi:hypothetical protein
MVSSYFLHIVLLDSQQHDKRTDKKIATIRDHAKMKKHKE